MGSYWTRAERLAASSLRAKPAKSQRFMMFWRLYVCETLLERLAQDLQDMAAALGPCIQEEHAIVGQRHLAGHRYLAATDQAHVREGIIRGVRKHRPSYSPGLQNNVWLQAGWREAIAEDGCSTATGIADRFPCDHRLFWRSPSLSHTP
jgi:hypothetical protein